MLLIGGGIIGLLPSVPIAAYGWFMHSGFSDDFTNQDRLMLYSPLICIAALLIGIGWSKKGRKKESIQPPHQ